MIALSLHSVPLVVWLANENIIICLCCHSRVEKPVHQVPKTIQWSTPSHYAYYHWYFRDDDKNNHPSHLPPTLSATDVQLALEIGTYVYFLIFRELG